MADFNLATPGDIVELEKTSSLGIPDRVAEDLEHVEVEDRFGMGAFPDAKGGIYVKGGYAVPDECYTIIETSKPTVTPYG